MRLTRAIRSSLLRRQSRLSGADAGTTLMEMVVVLFLLGLIGSMLIVFTTSAMRNTRYTDGQQQDLLQARNALDAMTKNLRSAVSINTSPVTLAFSQASNTSVTFYANNGTVTGALTNTGPTLTRYYFNTTTKQLIEETTDAVGASPPYTWPSTNKTTRVLASNLINPQPTRPDITGAQPLGGPIFSFSDRTGAAIAVDSTGAVSSLGLATIRQVQVWISLRSGSTNPSSITSITGQAQIVSGYDPDGELSLVKRPTTLYRMRRELDEGFAMIMVLITTLVVTAVVTLSLTIATNNLPQARRDQDWNAALGAAQAGVDDYRRHLNDNDTYWLNAGVDSTNTAFVSTGGRAFSATSGTTATFRYQVLTTVAQIKSSGVIRLRSTGTVNKVQRTITIDLRKVGFLKYGYLEDKSTVDPAMYPLFGQNQGYAYWSNLCAKYYYAGRSGGCSDVYFADSDIINGPFHSNDAVMLQGNPTFNSPIAESSWLSPSNVKLGGAVNYRQASGGGSPNSAGYPLVYAPALNFPPTNTAIQDQTNSALGGTGCLYTGPTKIVLNSAGTMTVLSPYTKKTNPGCSTALPMTSAQTVALPPNGVVYVQSIPASSSDPNYSNVTCGSQELGLYPPAADTETTYDCHVGDVFIEGTLKGQLTIAAANDIIATNNITYLNGTTGTDVLGLVANNYVSIMHPVSCTGKQSGPNCVNLAVPGLPGPLKGIEIDAALLSLNHAFTLQNFNEGARLSTPGNPATYRHVVGAVINNYSALDGTNYGNAITGMNDQFDYDSRLLTLPPPFFLQPTYAPWDVTSFSEEKPGT